MKSRLDDESWRLDAACSGKGPDIFFPEAELGEGGVTAEAHALCRACLVRDECLVYALADPELRGTWAGTSERHRRRMRQRADMSRRPTKEAIGW